VVVPKACWLNGGDMEAPQGLVLKKSNKQTICHVSRRKEKIGQI